MAAALSSPSPLFCFMGRGPTANACSISVATAVPSLVPTSASRRARVFTEGRALQITGVNGRSNSNSIRNMARSAWRSPFSQLRRMNRRKNLQRQDITTAPSSNNSTSSSKLTFFDVALRTLVFVSLFGFETIRSLAIFLGIFAAWSAFWLSFCFVLIWALELIPHVVDFVIINGMEVLMALLSLLFDTLMSTSSSRRTQGQRRSARPKTAIPRAPAAAPTIHPEKSEAELDLERWDRRFAVAHGPAQPSQSNHQPEMENSSSMQAAELGKKQLAEWNTAVTIRQMMREAINQDPIEP